MQCLWRIWVRCEKKSHRQGRETTYGAVMLSSFLLRIGSDMMAAVCAGDVLRGC